MDGKYCCWMGETSEMSCMINERRMMEGVKMTKQRRWIRWRDNKRMGDADADGRGEAVAAS
jgi:hypothetical protein